MNVIAHTFNILSAVSRDTFADLKLITECGRTLTVHKVIAAAVSPRWKKSLTKKQIDELPVRNVKFDALVNIVNFVYDGKIVLSSEGEAQDFADAFKVLEINLGKKVDGFIKRLNPDAAASDIESSSQEKLSQEKLSHEKLEFKCTNCNKDFQTMKQFRRHTREVHQGGRVEAKKEYKCEKCDSVYTVLVDGKQIYIINKKK